MYEYIIDHNINHGKYKEVGGYYERYLCQKQFCNISGT